MKTILLPIIVLLSCAQPAPVYDVKAEEAAIRAVLEAEQIAWNNGDIEKFMEGYWKSDSLQFMSNRGINKGWQETFDGYKRGYPDREAMGTLRFEIIKITPIDEIHFVVSGRYFVTRLSGNLDGGFTLIFKKIEGKWLAIYDHTS
jgi:hypothetical protein